MRKDTPKYIIQVARDLRKDQTDVEKKLWERLRDRRLGCYKFRRQYAISRYIADFYCSEAKLVIEVDGPIHQEQREYDDYRENEIMLRDITVSRFTNDEINTNIDLVLKQIEQRVIGILETHQMIKNKKASI